VAGRREILALYLEGKPLAPDVDVDLMARCTPGAHPGSCLLHVPASSPAHVAPTSNVDLMARCTPGTVPQLFEHMPG